MREIWLQRYKGKGKSLSMSTLKWLSESLECIDSNDTLIRQGRVWKPIAGFRKTGSIFCIYKDVKEYCVHVGEEWEENAEPLLGYYRLDLSWDELLFHIAQKYDSLRARSTS